MPKLRSACALMPATALPVLIVDLWILRINVNKKRKGNSSVEADQSAVFRVP